MSQARELTRARPRRSIDVGDSFIGAAFKGDGAAPGPAPDVWIVPQGGSLWDPSNSESMVAVILEGAISIPLHESRWPYHVCGVPGCACVHRCGRILLGVGAGVPS